MTIDLTASYCFCLAESGLQKNLQGQFAHFLGLYFVGFSSINKKVVLTCYVKIYQKFALNT